MSQRACSGIECLSGIPGSTGATPIQNVGAYGQEVASTITTGSGARPPLGRDRGARAQAVRLRLPDERLQAGARALGRCSRSSSSCARPAARSRSATRSSPGSSACELGDSGAARRGPRSGARAAPLQGDGARPGRPRHRSAGSFFTNPIVSASELEAIERAAGEQPPAWPEATGASRPRRRG